MSFVGDDVGQTEQAPPSLVEQFHKVADPRFRQVADLISHIRKPIPDQTGDGSDLAPEDTPEIVKKVMSAMSDFYHTGVKDIPALIEAAGRLKSGEPIDDREYLMERLIQAAAKFPEDSLAGKKVTDGFLSSLWDDLQHPPQSYLGGKYKYRSADGSFNSYQHPDLGKANTPYARTVTPKTMRSGALPEPGVVFDSIMARKHHDKHPNGISSMLFYLASIIIHDLFRTDHSDYNNSKTSSYLDLSPLYGSVQEEQDLMRTHHDGKIKPDCFSEKRLLSFPPGVGALLIMFNRFHNYVVEQLALLNEDKRFNKPEEGDAEKHAKYDEDLFQTGRLVTCGLYVNIILIDYVRTILNLNKTDSNWQLNPRAEIKQGPPMGVGNQVSAEFNLVYRWHSAISDRDERWTKELVDKMFDGKDQKDVGWYDFIKKAHEYESKFSDDPGEREFHGLQRDEHTGSFRDDDLIKILTESIDDCANAFGAQRVPEVMRNIEILGIIQARTWNVATLNEFRKHFNLTPYRKFEEINPDPYVADQLKHLYDHPDRVELYPGLVAEDTKTPMVPGAGLTPSFTVSRAVLSDANTLVRGDRFYTIDYHPRQLTNWGFREVQYDLGIDNGCVFYKLFLRAFPNSFEPNSIYAHYPLTIPTEMRKALDKLDAPDGGRRSKYYDWNRPGAMPQPKMVFTYAAADKILGNQQIYKVTWGKAMTFLMGDPAQDFMLAGDGYKNAESRKLMEKGLYLEGKWEREVKDYYEMITTKLLKEKSYKLAGVNQVDIIRDVGNLAHVHYAADLFALPLKGTGHPHQLFTEHELYLIMAAVFICVFFDLDPANSFPLRQKAHTVTQQFGKIVEATVRGVKHGGLVAWLVKKILPVQTSLRDYGIDLLKRLLQMEPDVNKLVWGNIMGTAGGMVANQGQLFGQTMDYYMDEGREHLPEINRLAKSDDPNDFATLMKYFLEGSRLYGETGVFRYVTEDIEVQDGDRMLKLKPGDRVMVNLKAASRDPQGFPNPDKVDLKRPIDSYIHLGGGPHQCLGLRMTRVALTTMFKVITRLDGLRPAPGPQGRVAKVLVSFGEDDNLPEGWHYHKYLTEDHDSYFPFPCSLKVNWDGDLL